MCEECGSTQTGCFCLTHDLGGWKRQHGICCLGLSLRRSNRHPTVFEWLVLDLPHLVWFVDSAARNERSVGCCRYLQLHGGGLKKLAQLIQSAVFRSRPRQRVILHPGRESTGADTEYGRTASRHAGRRRHHQQAHKRSKHVYLPGAADYSPKAATASGVTASVTASDSKWPHVMTSCSTFALARSECFNQPCSVWGSVRTD